MMIEEHSAFCKTLDVAKEELDELVSIDEELEKLGAPGKDADQPHVSTNPYTWFTEQTLEETWKAVGELVKNREEELKLEKERQKVNDELKKEFAENANCFHKWLTDARFVLCPNCSSSSDPHL